MAALRAGENPAAETHGDHVAADLPRILNGAGNVAVEHQDHAAVGTQGTRVALGADPTTTPGSRLTTEAVPVPCPGLSIHHQRFVGVGGVVVVVQQVGPGWCPPRVELGVRGNPGVRLGDHDTLAAFRRPVP